MTEPKDKPVTEEAPKDAPPQEREKTPSTVPEASTKGDEKEKAKFKPHKAFSKKAVDKLKGFRYSKENPAILTVLQHEESKSRILKTFIVVSLILGALLAAVFGYHEWKKYDAKARRVAALSSKMAELESVLSKSSGYEREQAALRICALIDDAIDIDYKVKDSFATKKDSLRKIISQSFPVLKLPKGQNFIVPSALIDMAHIPQGRFFMGRRSNESGGGDALPRRAITIPYEFWMARTETTNRQMRGLIPHFHVEQWAGYDLDLPRLPAASIDWHTASIFCKAITEAERDAKRLPEAYEYRLPTEAEWEYACRAGTETYYYWGDEFGDVGAKFSDSLDELAALTFGWKGEKGMAKKDGFLVSAPAGSYSPNSFGLYDMSGNVWEWCYDWYNPSAYRELPDSSPVQLKPLTVKLEKRRAFDAGTYEVDATCKVIRGGSWGNLPSQCRSASRDFTTPDDKNNGVGFRIVLAPVINPPVKR